MALLNGIRRTGFHDKGHRAKERDNGTVTQENIAVVSATRLPRLIPGPGRKTQQHRELKPNT
jgi:hypothetical protein